MKKIYRISKREESEEDRVHVRIRRAFERGRLNMMAYEGRNVQYVAGELSSSGLRVKPGDISIFFKVNGIADGWGSYAIDLRACADAKKRPLVKLTKRGGLHGNPVRERMGICLENRGVFSEYGSQITSKIHDSISLALQYPY
jgi:hypothetical protein